MKVTTSRFGKAIFLSTLLFGCALGQGKTITFDDLAPGSDWALIPNGYESLTWSGFGVYNGSVRPASEGYHTGTISASNVAFNVNGQPVSFGCTSTFDVHSAYVTAAVVAGMQVRVLGYAGTNVLYDNTFSVIQNTATLLPLNYLGVDRVSFIPSPTTQFALDNLEVTLPDCIYTISPTSRSLSSVSATGTVSVLAPGDCAWNVVTTNVWITILSGLSGAGNGTVLYSVAANAGTTAARTGTIFIAGQNFTLTQSGSNTNGSNVCTYALSPGSRIHNYGASTNTVSVTTQSGCAWNVFNTNAWVTILSSLSNSGSGAVTYSVSENTTSSTRSGNVRIDGQNFFVSQSGAPNTNVSTLAEALDTVGTPLVWTSGDLSGNWQWFSQTAVTHDGVDAARSAPITQTGASSILKTTVSGPGTLTFWWKTSARPPYDGLHFFIDGNQQAFIGGDVDWQQRTFALSLGGHTLQWMYWHDGGSSGSPGQDCGWVDQVQLVPPGTTGSCTFAISPASRTHGSASATGTVSVTTQSGCAWNVFNTNGWITIASGISNAGSGTVIYSVAANNSALTRSGNIRIDGQNFLVTQTGSNTNGSNVCTFVLSPTSATQNSGASTNTVSVTTQSGCAWSVFNTNAWITIVSGISNVGSGTVIYSIAANSNPSSRNGNIRIDGQNFLVTQLGSSNGSGGCTFSLSLASRMHGYTVSTGTVAVTTQSGCAWNVFNTNEWITILSGLSNAGSGTVIYSVAANEGTSTRSGNIRIDGQNFLVLQSANTNGSPACTFALGPTSATRSSAASTGTVVVTTQNGCAWSVFNTNAWLTIVSGVSNVGSGTVIYAITANGSASSRSGNIRIDGQNFLVTQFGSSNGSGVCTFALAPTSAFYSTGGGTGTVVVTTQTGCAWNVSETNSWISILSSLSNSANGTVIYFVAPNTNAQARAGYIRIDGQNFVVAQEGTSTNRLRLHFMGRDGNGSSLSIEGETGRTYVVECSEDLIHWTPISTNTSPAAVNDSARPDAPRRFYRTYEVP